MSGPQFGICLHDIVPKHLEDMSGFRGDDANWYKITPFTFRALLERVGSGCSTSEATEARVCWTFDDGGSASLHAADELERNSTRGWFFVPTLYIDRQGFLSSADIRDLASRGHVVGSHSHSHPIPISAQPSHAIAAEWDRSKSILEDLLGSSVADASIPGGFASSAVLSACASAGFGRIFTSSPQFTPVTVAGSQIIGRITVHRGSSLDQVRRLVLDEGTARLRAKAWWGLKGVAKSLGGQAWFAARHALMRYRAVR